MEGVGRIAFFCQILKKTNAIYTPISNKQHLASMGVTRKECNNNNNKYHYENIEKLLLLSLCYSCNYLVTGSEGVDVGHIA